MESMADPIALPEGAVAVRLSAGLAFSDDGGGTAEALLQNADHAMYHAKRRSPGEFLIYDPALRARSEERRRLKRALHGVVERDELRLHYQPLVRLNSGFEDLRRPAPPSGTIAAFEALVRWQDPAPRPAHASRVHRIGRGDRRHHAPSGGGCSRRPAASSGRGSVSRAGAPSP